MSSKQVPGLPAEGQYFNIETRLQYEDQETFLPLLIESYMLDMTVKDVIAGLLSLDLLNFVTEPAENLSLHVVLPAESGDGEEVKELRDECLIHEYLDDFSRCKMVKLLRRLYKIRTQDSQTEQEEQGQ